MTGNLLYTLVLIGLLGIGAQWLAWRMRMPAIVLLAAAGLIAGPVLGWVRPSADMGALLEPLIKLGVALILFEGGLSLRLHELKQTATGVKRLVIAGAPLAWALGSGAAHYIGGLSWPVALVFGAISVVTGPTVIGPLLRQARLKRRPASYLKWEGIINDPIGALLAVLTFQHFLLADRPLGEEILGLGLGVAAALALGAGGGLGLARLYVRGYVPEYLKPPLMVVSVLAIYALANHVQEEAGLLAATVFGITVGNMRLPSIDELRRFKEYVTVILVSGVFVLLTADLDPAILEYLDWRAAALIAAMLLVVRPLTVILATTGSGVTAQERTLLAWIAPRGIVAAAVAGVFGPELVANGYADAALLVPLVFALIFVTVVAHGLSIGSLARRLGLAAAARHGLLIVGASPWTTALAKLLKEMEVPVIMADWSWHRLREARLEGIPAHYGEILSERAEEALELGDIGFLLAATDNDAYNALVCTRFANELGRQRVFQLPMYAADEHDPRGVAAPLRGQSAFGDNAQFEELLRRFYQGWTFRKTRITEGYGFDAFQNDMPPDGVPIAMLRSDGTLRLPTTKTPLEGKEGDTVVSFVPPRVTESKQQTDVSKQDLAK
jgi:NhaP-type Na+/H+ or K+/H+ antiporter